MKNISRLIRFAFGVSVAVVLVGCGGSGTAPISSVPGVAGGALPAQGTDGLTALLASAQNRAKTQYRIYVVNYFNFGETYNSNGKQIAPMLFVGFSTGITVDTNGKIYVTSELPTGKGYLSMLMPDGTKIPSHIKNLFRPSGVAVDANGKIYITSPSGGPSGSVLTYNQNGSPTTPTITKGISGPAGLAIDTNGKIYVANSSGNNVTTYTADGRPTKPTIRVRGPRGVAIDKNGKIYVLGGVGSSSYGVTSYFPDGKQTTPTITAGLDNPISLAVDPNGKILVVNFGSYESGPWSVTSYKANGNQTTPTITAGLSDAEGIAIH